jgi:surface antigen
MSKTTRTLSGLGAALLLAVGANAAHAANLGFLHDTPASYMKQADYDSLTKAVRAAVDQKQDGESTTWTNEGLRNSVPIEATITPTKTDKDGDNTCRTMQVAVTAKQQTMTLLPVFCRQGSGAWVYQKKH